MKRKKYLNFKRETILILLAIVMLLSAVIMFWISTFKIPDLNNFEERIITQSTKIYDRTGEILLYDVHEDIRRTIIPYEEISHHIKNATIAIEDAEFYEHSGIKPTSFIRAIFANILSGNFSQGGSTITQQVVKNSVLTKEKKISRKIKEWVLAIKLEKMLTKKEILTLYLNEAPYGGNLYGVEEASQSFFGKSAVDLSLAESAYLAAIPQAPTFYSPYGENTDRLEVRKNLVLKKMLENKFITEEEHDQAKDEKITFRAKQTKGIKAAHFVMYVREYLSKKYGEDVLTTGGYKVITTLDYDLQEKAEIIVKEKALQNEKDYNAENASLVAVEAKTGQILTMVGSRDYFDENIDGNFNVATAHRQPGSSFKPFVYATAFNKGFTPDTVVFDVKTEFSTYCNADGTPQSPQYADRCYSPVNYDNVYRGPVTFRDALAQSLNVPAVKVLYLAGLKDSLKTAKDMGINSLTNVGQYGLTLVLGGGEVSLLDMTTAYTVFANEGIGNPSTAILRVEDKNGNVLEEFEDKSKRILPEKSALYISNILSDNEARTPAFGASSPLYFGGRDVAGKTGTTNDYKDAWTVGYIPQVAVGVWAGNNDNTSMEKKVAGFIVTPIWNAFMQEVLKKYPNEDFREPPLKYDQSLKPVMRGIWQGGTTYIIDKMSGKLATEFTPEETREEKVIEEYHSILYWVDKDDPLGPKPTNPYNDPQFSRWEYGVQKWITAHGLTNGSGYIPTEYDNIHTQGTAPRISILSPKSDTAYDPNEKINILISNDKNVPLIKVNYYLNGQMIGSSINNVFSFLPSEIDSIRDNNELKVIGFDSLYNKGEAVINLKLKI
ncbi:MAG: transglycosylase domain-containing protein [Candidatus Pacebacteria bacterium]|nr:transglycosylase domain-containing protein [Candidatus Paceibacterota bacterium]